MRTGPDLMGKKFGLLYPFEKVHVETGKWMWRCRCDCGREFLAHSAYLQSGKIKSCGCFKRSRLGAERKRHGMTGSQEYVAWASMKARCYYPKYNHYERYGARGIAVCERWLNSFENFLADMGPRPSLQHSVGRINNDLGYFPENCRWETHKEQAANRTFTAEGRSRISAARKAYFTPENRAKISAARKAYWAKWREAKAACSVR